MVKIINYAKGNYTITTDKDKIDLDKISNLFSNNYLNYKKTRDGIIETLNNSLCFSIFKGENQIGFARVISDYSTFALLCDVYIDEAFRGKGIGTWMMECILSHPNLQQLSKWLVNSNEAKELYEKFGFSYLKNSEGFLELCSE